MSKILYLVRHAKSSWKYQHLSDIDRPLNKRGQRDVPEMSDRLKSKNIGVDLIISSPAERAKTVALYFATEIATDKNVLLINSLYHANAAVLFQEISHINNKYNDILIVGHNPGLTDFVNQLGDLSIENIPTCGIVAFDLPISEWASLKPACAKLSFFDYPKNIN